jgi:metal-responsive CopG/Arc/MetJ family transcriptional regulator
MERFQMFIPAPLIKQLKALAKRKDMSVSELVRIAIAEFLTKHGD